MCAIAEIWFPFPESKRAEIEELIESFDAVVDRYQEEMRITIRAFKGRCFCKPLPESQGAMRTLLEVLATKTAPLSYSPNDYSDNPSECRFLELYPEEISKEWMPSLETGPTRILVLNPSVPEGTKSPDRTGPRML